MTQNLVFYPPCIPKDMFGAHILSCFFFLIRYEKFIEREETYSLEEENTPSWSFLQASTKHKGPDKKSKQPQKQFIRDHLARLWGASLATRLI